MIAIPGMRCDDHDQLECWMPQPHVSLCSPPIYQRMVLFSRMLKSVFDPLHRFERLETVRFVARGRDDAWNHAQSRPTLDCTASPRAIASQLALLAAPRFTRLELDFPGAGPSYVVHGTGAGDQCRALNRLLRALPRLAEFRLRVACFCAELFAADAPAAGTAALETLIVYRGAGPEAPHLRACGTGARWMGAEAVQGVRDRAPKLLAEAAPAWVRGMKRPRVVRVVWLDERSAAKGAPRNLVRDGLTGECRALAVEAAWTAAGTELTKAEHRMMERGYPRRGNLEREIKQLRGWK